MLVWIILGIAWIAILAAGVCLYKVTGYAEQKFRSINTRVRHNQDRAA